jgi:hypothetical protein
LLLKWSIVSKFKKTRSFSFLLIFWGFEDLSTQRSRKFYEAVGRRWGSFFQETQNRQKEQVWPLSLSNAPTNKLTLARLCCWLRFENRSKRARFVLVFASSPQKPLRILFLYLSTILHTALCLQISIQWIFVDGATFWTS